MTATVEIEVKRADDALSLPVQAVVHRRLKDLPATHAVSRLGRTSTEDTGRKGQGRGVAT